MCKRAGFVCTAWLVASAPGAALAASPAAEAGLFDAAFLSHSARLATRYEGLSGFGADDRFGLRLATLGRQSPEAVIAPKGAMATRYDVALTLERQWTARLASSRRYRLDITPEAGLGLSGGGHLAEAGATVQVSRRLPSQMGEALNVGSGEAQYGERGRWYLFGALRGRAVGLNLTRSPEGMRGEGLTADRGGFMGLMQTGFGWRKGGLQTSIGYTYTNIKGRQLGRTLGHEERLGVSFSLRP